MPRDGSFSQALSHNMHLLYRPEVYVAKIIHKNSPLTWFGFQTNFSTLENLIICTRSFDDHWILAQLIRVSQLIDSECFAILRLSGNIRNIYMEEMFLAVLSIDEYSKLWELNTWLWMDTPFYSSLWLCTAGEADGPTDIIWYSCKWVQGKCIIMCTSVATRY